MQTSAPSPITVNAAQPGMLAPSSFIIGGKQHGGAAARGWDIRPSVGAIPGLSTRPASQGETF